MNTDPTRPCCDLHWNGGINWWGTTHDCPRDGEGMTLCCGRTPFDLPRSDHMTIDATLVTCTGNRHL
jgi:hypothetical protein